MNQSRIDGKLTNMVNKNVYKYITIDPFRAKSYSKLTALSQISMYKNVYKPLSKSYAAIILKMPNLFHHIFFQDCCDPYPWGTSLTE